MTDQPGLQHLDETEARLRSAIATRTGQVQPDGATGLHAIRQRAQVARRHRRVRRGFAGALTVAAAIVLVAIAVPALRDDGRERVSATGRDGSTTTTAATSSTTVPVEPAPPLAVWPPLGHEQYADPSNAARAFVGEYVGLPDPPLSDFRPGPPMSGEIDVYQRGENRGVLENHVLSTIALRRTLAGWTVAGARTDDIVVDNPAPSMVVGSPVVVDGKGRGYEGTIIVNVRDGGMGAGETLGQGIGIAGCCDELLPFHLEVALDRPPSQPTGSVLLNTDSGLDPVASFAVVPVRFGPTPTILRQLHATVFQFPTVTSAEYRVGGSCDAFWSWLQRPCTRVDKKNPGT